MAHDHLVWIGRVNIFKMLNLSAFLKFIYFLSAVPFINANGFFKKN